MSFTVINKIKKHRCIIIFWLIDSSSSDLEVLELKKNGRSIQNSELGGFILKNLDRIH